MPRKKKPQASPQGELFVAPDARTATTEELAEVTEKTAALARCIAELPLCARIEALNLARTLLHEVSPFAREPVDLVLWVPHSCVLGNEWNPNQVPPPEMVALGHSVRKYGYTNAIVGSWISGWTEPSPTWPGDYRRGVRINDGFHRNIVGRQDEGICARLYGHLPITVLSSDLSEADLMSATMLHNEARGTHNPLKERALLATMDKAGWTTAQIGVGLVKSQEEIIRLRQSAGVPTQLANRTYDKAWEW